MKEARVGWSRLFALPMLLVAGNAVSDGNINLMCTNDGIVDIYVTVYDMSTTPATAVVSRQRMNGYTSIPLAVNPDASGKANVSWTAISVDVHDRQCGHGTMSLDDGASLNVHVDTSACPGQ